MKFLSLLITGIMLSVAFSAGALINLRASATRLSFPDVPHGQWFSASVDQLSSLGIIRGRPDGMYHPDDQINRAEMAELLGRYHTYLLREYFQKRAVQDEIFLELQEEESLSQHLPQPPLSNAPLSQGNRAALSLVLAGEPDAILADVYKNSLLFYQEECASSGCEQIETQYACDIISPVEDFLPKVPMMICDNAIDLKDFGSGVFLDMDVQAYHRTFITKTEGQITSIDSPEEFSKTFAPIQNDFDALNFLLAATRETPATQQKDLMKHSFQGGYEWILKLSDFPFTKVEEKDGLFFITLFSTPKFPCGASDITAKKYRVSRDAQYELLEAIPVGQYSGRYSCK